MLVRCISTPSAPTRLKLGMVYEAEINTSDPDLYLIKHPNDFSPGNWKIARFIPFKWQVGDRFEIVQTGAGLDETHLDKIGILTQVVASTWIGSSVMWKTDIKLIDDMFLYVSEDMIKFVQPTLASKPQKMEQKARRYLNKGNI